MSEGLENKKHSNNRPLETLKIKSSKLLLLDQFMLANKQFLNALNSLTGGKDKHSELCNDWGGAVVELDNGEYLVDRFPTEPLILLRKKEALPDEPDSGGSLIPDFSKDNFSSSGRVFVDTRCLIVADASILEKTEVLKEYGEQREHEGEKAARDYLRSQGAAVRYGFNRYGDELGVFSSKEKDSLALWPDVVEN